MKFTTLPLNIVFELVYKTNTKLNLKWQNKCLIEESELSLPEYHTLVFEGKIGEYDNSIDGILKMRNKLKSFRQLLKDGELDDVSEWTITNIDECIKEP